MTEPHRLAVRIFWEDTDASGIVYYANYLRFLERGRSDVVRGAGIDQTAMYNFEGVMFPVRRCEIDYLKPAQLDDEIEVRTRLRKIGGVSDRCWNSLSRARRELSRLTGYHYRLSQDYIFRDAN